MTRILSLLLAAAVLAGGPDARAGPVTQHLLEKGVAELTRAERAWHAKDYATAKRHGIEAERFFRDALAQDASDRRARLLGGQAAAFTRDMDRARHWLKGLFEQTPRGDADPDVQYLSAFIQFVAGERPDLAIRALKRMFSLNPRWRPEERDGLWFLALHDLGGRYMRARKFNEAIAQFRSGARLARRTGDRAKEMAMLGNVAIAMRRADRFIEAGEILEKLMAAEPQDPVWPWHMGLNLATQSRFAEAIPYYRKVIALTEAGHVSPSLKKDMEKVHLRLGNCLRIIADQPHNVKQRVKLLTEAEERLRHYMKIAPSDPLGHKWLGILLLEDVRPARPYEALEQFHKAFELDEVCEDALKYIIRIHERFPPPPEQLPADDPAAAAAARDAWKAPIAAWRENIRSGKDRRHQAREARAKKTGETGCD